MNVIQITEGEYRKAVSKSCRTLSGGAWPGSGARTYKYAILASQFLSKDVYLVRFVDATRTTIIEWDSSGSQPVTVQEFSRNKAFVDDLMRGWKDKSLIQTADLICLFCTGCHRRIVIDGVHRIVWIETNNKSAVLNVIELCGTKWPKNTPDMDIICQCSRDTR